MQMEQTTQLRHVLEFRGNPPSQHPDYEQECFLSFGTGDYVCTTYGAYVDPGERRKRK